VKIENCREMNQEEARKIRNREKGTRQGNENGQKGHGEGISTARGSLERPRESPSQKKPKWKPRFQYMRERGEDK